MFYYTIPAKVQVLKNSKQTLSKRQMSNASVREIIISFLLI